MPTTELDWSDIDACAKELAGNHKRFDSFAWFERPDDSDNWAIVYFENRDSDILTRCNAIEYRKALEPFTDGDDDTPDVVYESHSHWLCGHVDGASIRVYRADGSVTDAFRKYCELREQESIYPVLNETAWSDMEYEEAQEAWEQWGRDDLERSILESLRKEDEGLADEYEKWDGATERLYQAIRDRLPEPYFFDNGGCNLPIDTMQELIDEMEAEEFWTIVQQEETVEAPGEGN